MLAKLTPGRKIKEIYESNVNKLAEFTIFEA